CREHRGLHQKDVAAANVLKHADEQVALREADHLTLAHRHAKPPADRSSQPRSGRAPKHEDVLLADRHVCGHPRAGYNTRANGRTGDRVPPGIGSVVQTNVSSWTPAAASPWRKRLSRM